MSSIHFRCSRLCGWVLLVSLVFYGPVLQAKVSESFQVEANPADPWQGVNRRIFDFNAGVDRFTVKPAAKAYETVVPGLLRQGVGNFFDNLANPLTGTNNFLQAKFKQGAQDFLRFGVNLTLGLLGCFDVASRLDIPQHDEDFGQTLGYWGVPSGPYVMLPFFGPSTVRDALVIPLDRYFSVSRYIDHVPTRNTGMGLSLMDTRVELLEYEALIVGDAYVFVRDAYLQRREFAVKDGQVEDPFLDDDW